MKSIYLIILIILSFKVQSQITEDIDNPKVNIIYKEQPLIYDSLSNIEFPPIEYHLLNDDIKQINSHIKANFNQYIGQTLYLTDLLESNEYFLLSNKPYLVSKSLINDETEISKITTYSTYIYKPKRAETLNYYDLKFTNNNELVKKYFKILSINMDVDSVLSSLFNNYNNYIPNNDSIMYIPGVEYAGVKSSNINKQYTIDTLGTTYYGKNIEHPILMLENIENGDTVYCLNSEPFIIVGYFEKAKKLYANVKLIDYDIYSRIKYFEYTCIDVTLMKDEICKDFPDGGYCKKFIYLKLKGINTDTRDNKEFDRNIKLEDRITKYRSLLTENEYNLIKQKEKEQDLLKNKIKDESQKEDDIKKLNEQKQTDLKQENYKDSCILKYGVIYGNKIALKEIVIGMTKEMCIASWGKPSLIKKRTTNNGTEEIWIYKKYNITNSAIKQSSIIFSGNKAIEVNEVK